MQEQLSSPHPPELINVLPPQHERRRRIIMMPEHPFPPKFSLHPHPEPQFVAAKSLILLPPKVVTLYIMQHSLYMFTNILKLIEVYIKRVEKIVVHC